MSDRLDPAAAPPLLCAGITMYRTYEWMLKSDAWYRFVIDIASVGESA